MQEIPRCSRCILPRSDFFSFDSEGVCSLCNISRRNGSGPEDTAGLERKLLECVQQIKAQGRGRAFDCVVGLSGGRDSSYLLYLLTRKHDLRCLAAYYRTPFTSDAVDANVRRVTDTLSVPLVEMLIPREHHRRLAREFTVLWAEQRHPVIANMACAPCKLLNRELFRIARSKGVKAVILGDNRFEALQIATGTSRTTTLTTNSLAGRQLKLVAQLKNNLLLVKRGTQVLKTTPRLWKHLSLGIQASVMYISPYTPFLRICYPGIRVLAYFYFAEWRERECEAALAEVGWELPPGCRSTWKSDCCFAEVKNYMFRQMTGATYMDALLSNMIRAGIITREEALERIEVEGVPSAQRLSMACKILELPLNLSSLITKDAAAS